MGCDFGVTPIVPQIFGVFAKKRTRRLPDASFFVLASALDALDELVKLLTLVRIFALVSHRFETFYHISAGTGDESSHSVTTASVRAAVVIRASVVVRAVVVTHTVGAAAARVTS